MIRYVQLTVGWYYLDTEPTYEYGTAEEQLYKFGLEIDEIERDGNHLFISLALQLPSIDHIELRKQIYYHARASTTDEYQKHYPGTEKDYNAHVLKLKTDEWWSHKMTLPVLHMLSSRYRKRIVVIEDNKAPLVIPKGPAEVDDNTIVLVRKNGFYHSTLPLDFSDSSFDDE